MEILELMMYICGLALDVWFMAHIPRFVRAVEARIGRKKATRPTRYVDQVTEAIEAISHMDCTTTKEAHQVEMRYTGIIKDGEIVKIKGDSETLKSLVENEMAKEIERLRRENSRLSAELGLVKTGRARDIKRRRVVAVRKKQRPEWFESAKVRLLTWWAVKTLGAEAVYGESKPLPEMVRVRGGWVPVRKIVAGGER